MKLEISDTLDLDMDLRDYENFEEGKTSIVLPNHFGFIRQSSELSESFISLSRLYLRSTLLDA